MNQSVWVAIGSGFIMQLGLIMSLGLQNLFVIKKGLRKEYPYLVAFTCCLCEVILLLVGANSGEWLAAELPGFKQIMLMVAPIFLCIYGISSIRRSFKDSHSQKLLADQAKSSLAGSVLAAVGFSLLNPQAIIEGILFFGSASQQQGEFGYHFLGGAVAASALWLYSLAAISSNPRSKLTAKNLRILEGVSGFILIGIGINLLV